MVMSVAVELRRISFHFDDGTCALRDVSFAVDSGECVALIGPNGAGKSTTLLHLAGLLPEPGAGHAAGDVFVFGQRVQGHISSEIRRRVGLLCQDPDDQLFCPTVGDDVGFGPSQGGLRDAELKARVAEALATVGLSGFEDRMPHRLSGGEKKRVALAGLLAYRPEILVFDEPTSGLDPRGRRQLIAVLTALRATRVIATHDLALVAELCARTIVLDGGQIVADGKTADILCNDDLMFAHGLERPRLDLPARCLNRESESVDDAR
jgi:cobalt/nickel transport system ATP-binding protein